MTLLGKALSGGFYPVSAVLSNSEVLGVLQPGQHGSTFGGNPLACAVACAALDVLIEEDMIANAASMGAYLKAGLEAVRTDAVREVRGRGLMLAIELHKEAGPARALCGGAGAPRRADQGRARADDPHRPAAHRHARGGRLGDRAICRGAEVGARDLRTVSQTADR